MQNLGGASYMVTVRDEYQAIPISNGFFCAEQEQKEQAIQQGSHVQGPNSPHHPIDTCSHLLLSS